MVGSKEKEHSLVTGNLWLTIWTMSWPLILTTVANSFVGLVDVQVAGSISAAAQAAVGLAEHILFIFMLSLMSIGVGTTALVSRAYGAQERPEMLKAAAQSLVLSLLIGLFMAVVAQLTSHYVLETFAASPEVFKLGRDYLDTYSLVLIPFSLTVIANAAFRAIGDSKTPLVIVTIMTSINVALDYLTVLHNWPVPGLGIRGMAYAGLAASLTGACLAIYFLKKSILKDALASLLPLDQSMLSRICKIGIPSALQRLGWTLSSFAVFGIMRLCPDSVAALASWAIGMRLEAFVFMPLMALSLSVSSIIGQNLGAKEVDRAYKAGWRVTYIGIWMMLIAGTALYVFAEPIAGTMAREPKALAYTIDYLRINALAEPFLALAMILAGALQGAGDTRTPMWMTIISNWLIRIPLGYALAIPLHLGVTGIWWAMACSIMIQGTVLALRYKSKDWIHEKI